MNYELALKLKEAGYPQNTKCECCSSFLDDDTDDLVILPTLSELIEACGKTRIGLNQNTKEKKPIKHLFRLGYADNEWFACYSFYESQTLNSTGQLEDGWGATPEEAVANLWLELNK